MLINVGRCSLCVRPVCYFESMTGWSLKEEETESEVGASTPFYGTATVINSCSFLLSDVFGPRMLGSRQQAAGSRHAVQLASTTPMKPEEDP